MTTPAAQLELGGLEPRRDHLIVPARPTPNHTLTGYCNWCRRWILATETNGELDMHHYPKWDRHGRRGYCGGSRTQPKEHAWRRPLE